MIKFLYRTGGFYFTDRIAEITVIEMEFDKLSEYRFASYYPQLHGGSDIAGEDNL